MNIDQKIAKIDMFFRYRFGVALGWVLEGGWEAKNLNFGSFFEQKSKAKRHDVLEGPKELSRRRKKQSRGARAILAKTKETKFSAKLPAGGVGGVQPKTNMLVI